jgi:putative aldouronate transport system substrate-binding protein
MFKTRTLIWLLAVTVFCAALVVSCGGGSRSATTTADGLSVVRIYGINKRIIITGDELKLSDWYDGTMPSRFWEQLNAEFAKNGVKVELDLIMSDQIATAYQTLLASNRVNDYDFISAGGLSVANAQAQITQNRAYALNRAFEEHSKGPARDFYNNDPGGQFMKKSFTVEDGNFYWITNAQADFFLDPSNVVSSHQSGMIRADWLQQLGLRIPTTLDEFYNALVAFQANDMNKNGIRDEVAAISLEHFSTGVAQWFGLGWEASVSLIDNKIVSPWYQPNVQDYIT